MAWWEWVLVIGGSLYGLWLVVWLLVVGIFLTAIRRSF